MNKPIVSLTSYGKRIQVSAYRAICTLLDQTVPARVILYLDKGDVPTDELRSLQCLEIIEDCDNVDSFTKLIPALQQFPNEVIVTADDDMYYPRNWLEQLLERHDKYPDQIIAHFATSVGVQDNKILPYGEWRRGISDTGINLFPIGAHGVLYPPNSLHKDITNKELFMKLCPKADDIWFWAMGVLNGTQFSVVPNGYREPEHIDPLRKAGGSSLWEYNVGQGGNDRQLQQVLSHYPQLHEKMCEAVTVSLYTARTKAPATKENALFATICDYPNPEEMSRTISKTAERHGIPLRFASYGQPFTCLYEKLSKMLAFLKRQPNTIKYVFFVDCRDTVFAKPIEEILAAFNSTYPGGLLVQSGGMSLTRDYISHTLANQIANKYTAHGFACSGCYCGEITEVIKVLERAIQLYDNIQKRNYNDPIASLYLNDPNSRNSIDRLKEHDEFMFQLLQLEENSPIKPDRDKRVSALFANDRPNQGHVPIDARRKAPIESILSVGGAGILHSPLLSRSVPMWSQWVDENIVNYRPALPAIKCTLPKAGLHNTTIVTRIRNRNSIFADTLPNWLRFNVPIIVVDWRDDGCESAYDIVKGVPNVTYIETKYEYMFYQTAAWNLGVSQAKTDYVLNVDVDDLLHEAFFEVNSINGSEFAHFPLEPAPHLYGLSWFSKKAFDAVNGYSENMLYMQHSDRDFYQRLEKAGYSRKYLIDRSATHKPHDDEMRVCNTVQDKELLTKNQNGRRFLDVCRVFNEALAPLLPWSPESSRIKWTLTETETNRLLAVRNVSEI